MVDLFAGAGGLAEGFSRARGSDGESPFSILLSVEKDPAAHSTLLFRSFLRQFQDGFPPEYYDFLNSEIEEPEWSDLYPEEWQAASQEALCLELGTLSARRIINGRLAAIRRKHGKNVVLIGGPPCQAYSIVGRSRNKGVAGYRAKDDHRHFLYREYIRILKTLQPAAFVMENVIGLLSSAVDGESVFQKVLSDLRAAGRGRKAYQLMPMVVADEDDGKGNLPKGFIVKAEDFGVPQSRHRVIIVGIRRDCISRSEIKRSKRSYLKKSAQQATVRDVLEGMPRLRSGLSQKPDSEARWRRITSSLMIQSANLRLGLPKGLSKLYRERACRHGSRTRRANDSLERIGHGPASVSPSCPVGLRRWLSDSNLEQLPNHVSRTHMSRDLQRYFFAALFAQVSGRSPIATDYPTALHPDHKSWAEGGFADRFRVQLWDKPSTTVTCHISKDGHYFIHPDPSQCRSLTVREAARLQTFPDNYLFKGNRTQQYVQVGNAVPPYLAKQIAESLHALLG